MATYQDYRAQWKHPEWQKRRLQIMELAGFECENCGDKETTLNVHHKRYIKGRKVWEYDDDLLVCLCEPCHEREHEDRELLNMILAEAGTAGVTQIAALAAGFMDATCSIDPGLGHMGKEADLMYFELGVVAAAAEQLGVEGWRDVVRKVVRERKHTTPTLRGMVEQWDEESKKG